MRGGALFGAGWLLVGAALVFGTNGGDPAQGAAALKAFGATGQSVVWDVPADVHSITIKLWGAGGSNQGKNGGYKGGAGGYAEATLAVSPGDKLTFVAGMSGTPTNKTLRGWPGGAAGRTSGDPFGGGGVEPTGWGGGYSAVFRGACAVAPLGDGGTCNHTNVLLVAGGGGGAGKPCDPATPGVYGENCQQYFHSAERVAYGGNGGGTTGVSSSNATGGTQTAGGGGAGGKGSQFQGGVGSSNSNYPSRAYSGGGGGGWYGGGGGSIGEQAGTGGAGGSGYLSSNAQVSGGRLVASPKQNVAVEDPDRPSTVGGAGQNGYVLVLGAVVQGPPSPPTLSIKAGSAAVGRGARVTVGKPITITATFKEGTYKDGTEDRFLGTAIDGPNTTDSVPGVPWDAPYSPKQYVFTPEKPGDYTFIPAAKTQYYNDRWNDYGKSVTVRATYAACTNGTDNPPECTHCTDPNKQYNPGTNRCELRTSCDFPLQTPPACNCPSDYSLDPLVGCKLKPPQLSLLEPSPARVLKGATSNITWQVKRLPQEGGVDCRITSNPAGVFGRVMPEGTHPTWGGTAPTGPVPATTVITLSCDGFGSVSVTVGLLPSYQER